MLTGLALGVALIIVANLGLARFTPLPAAQAAAAVALTTLVLYLPWVMVAWPGGDVVAVYMAIYLCASFICGVFLTARVQDRSSKQSWHWGPMAIIGFFVVLIGVDSVFILLAQRGLAPSLGTRIFPGDADKGAVQSSFPGVISHDFQEKEALYNAYLQRRREQAERGWQVQKGWLSKPIQGEPAIFKVAARTQDGEPIVGAVVEGRFLRPSDSRLDTEFTLPEVEPGIYQTQLSLPAPGRWNLVLLLQRDGAVHEIRANTSVLAR